MSYAGWKLGMHTQIHQLHGITIHEMINYRLKPCDCLDVVLHFFCLKHRPIITKVNVVLWKKYLEPELEKEINQTLPIGGHFVYPLDWHVRQLIYVLYQLHHETLFLSYTLQPDVNKKYHYVWLLKDMLLLLDKVTSVIRLSFLVTVSKFCFSFFFVGLGGGLFKHHGQTLFGWTVGWR